MKKLLTVFVFVVIAATTATSQWKNVFATHDDTPNGTGHQTISTSAVNSKVFVALVNRPVGIQIAAPFDEVNILKDSSAANYLVAYSNATFQTGRLGTYPYGTAGTSGLYSKWFSGFDEVYLYRANKIVATPDSLVYVANNDPDHNILVFKVTSDSIISTDYRMKTGSNDIHGLAVDNNGNVYVSEVKGTSPQVKVFKGVNAAGNTWATTHDDAPISSIALPEGVYRGLTVNGTGTSLFVSNMVTRSVAKYSGTPASGYGKNATFSFTMSAADTIPGTQFDTNGTSVWNVGRPLGMAYLNGNNILFVAADRWLGFSIKARNANNAYNYGKIFMLNPITGAEIGVFDVADNYYINSSADPLNRSYTVQIFSDTLNVSGYTSVYDVAFDENKDLYSQSMYSWTVDKWHYDGTLPTTTSVQRESELAPAQFTLEQNYPNPFNPSTTIRFAVKAKADVSLKVYDVLGKEVATLVNEQLNEGSYSATFNAQTLSTGLYFYTLRAGSFSETKKMLLTK